MIRRSAGAALAAAVAAGTLVPGLDLATHAQEEAAPATSELSKDAKSALEGGLAFLAAEQGEDGSSGPTASGNESVRVAVTSLAGLAFLAGGSTPTRGPYRASVLKSLEAVLRAARQPKGMANHVRFGGPGDEHQQGRMHAHGFALLFLAECYGMLGEKKKLQADVRKVIEGAIKVSLASQTKKGGWGYGFATDEDSRFLSSDEASTTITQIQGLRAARNAGFVVSAKAIDRAVEYVKKCIKEGGDCQYSLTMTDGARTSFELTAAAVATLNASGTYKSEKLDAALAYMRREQQNHKNPALACKSWYFYGNLYAAQAMFQVGGSDWAQWFRGAQTDLLEKSRRRGATVSWEDTRSIGGDSYATASACLILALPLRYLPIFER